MSAFTWLQIKTKLTSEHSIEAEEWIDEAELLAYANEAIRDVSAEIHTLYEDYFLTYTSIPFVAGTEKYALPNDIYAMKIRRFLYEDDAIRYPITRVRDWKKFEEKSLNDYYTASSEQRYEYFIINESVTDGPRILITPTPQKTGNFAKLWYLREANTLAVDADVCDVPEFINFVLQHMKWRIYEKEGHPNTLKAEKDLILQRNLMVSTLEEMVVDAENEIEPDFSIYEELN